MLRQSLLEMELIHKQEEMERLELEQVITIYILLMSIQVLYNMLCNTNFSFYRYRYR